MKLNIKKGCPDCKSDAYRRIQRKWWMKFFPGIKYYQCNHCYKRFITFLDISSLIEYRNDHRYCPGPDCCVELTINEIQSGHLVDISRNGLCFLCPDGIQDSGLLRVKIQAPDCSECLDLHVKTVSRETVPFSMECQDYQDRRNKISAKFIDFPREQHKLLNLFIKKIRESAGKLGPAF